MTNRRDNFGTNRPADIAAIASIRERGGLRGNIIEAAVGEGALNPRQRHEGKWWWDRPECEVCHAYGPTIDGRCTRHLKIETETWLDTVSADETLEDQQWHSE